MEIFDLDIRILDLKAEKPLCTKPPKIIDVIFWTLN